MDILTARIIAWGREGLAIEAELCADGQWTAHVCLRDTYKAISLQLLKAGAAPRQEFGPPAVDDKEFIKACATYKKKGIGHLLDAYDRLMAEIIKRKERDDLEPEGEKEGDAIESAN